MTSQTIQALVLRDGEGNFYLVSQDVLNAGKVPADKQQALQQAISGEVSGYIFNFGAFQAAATTLTQNNTNTANNVLIGGFVGGNTQSISQAGINIGSAGTQQAQA